MERHPVSDAYAYGGDLVLAPAAVGQLRLIGPGDPDTDPVRPALGRDVEAGEGADGPFLEVEHEAPHVLPARPQVEHGIDHALAWAMVGVLAAAARDMDGKAQGLQQIC